MIPTFIFSHLVSPHFLLLYHLSFSPSSCPSATKSSAKYYLHLQCDLISCLSWQMYPDSDSEDGLDVVFPSSHPMEHGSHPLEHGSHPLERSSHAMEHGSQLLEHGSHPLEGEHSSVLHHPGPHQPMTGHPGTHPL